MSAFAILTHVPFPNLSDDTRAVIQVAYLRQRNAQLFVVHPGYLIRVIGSLRDRFWRPTKIALETSFSSFSDPAVVGGEYLY